jgi:hypothetical protein
MSSFLANNPHLRENYLEVCERYGVVPYTDEAPEELGMVSLRLPTDEEVRYFQRLHGLPTSPSESA